MTTLHLTLICASTLVAIFVVADQARRWAESRAQHQRETAMHERAVAAPVGALAAAVEALTAAAARLEHAAGERAPSRVGQRVTVHTKRGDDRTFFGVVVGDYTDRLVLEDADLVHNGGTTPLPGRQDINRVDIAWIDAHGDVTIPAAPAEREGATA